MAEKTMTHKQTPTPWLTVQWIVQRRETAGDVLPVQAKREEAHAFVSTRTAKDVGKYRVVLAGKAENADPRQNGHDPLRNNLYQNKNQLAVERI
jgi:hypothetical protein